MYRQDSLIADSIQDYIHIDDEQPCDFLRGENVKFWDFIRMVAQTNPNDLIPVGFDQRTIERLANLTRFDMNKLSSGVMLAFKLRDNERSLISSINAPMDPLDPIINSEADGQLQKAYWYFRQMKVSLQTLGKGLWATTFAYGVSTNFLHYLDGSNDAQLWATVFENNLDYEIRISNTTINAILDDNNEYSLNNAFIPYLEAISNSNENPSKLFANEHKIESLKNIKSSFATYSNSDCEELVKRLFLLGSTRTMMVTESGLSRKVIERIEKNLLDHEGLTPLYPQAATLPSVKFIKNTESIYHATLFMTIYRHICRNYCEHEKDENGNTINKDAYIQSTILINPLVKAFKIYHAILNEIKYKFQKHKGYKEPRGLIFIECYVLAKELKDRAASFFEARNVSLDYFFCDDQAAKEDNPFYSKGSFFKYIQSDEELDEELDENSASDISDKKITIFNPVVKKGTEYLKRA